MRPPQNYFAFRPFFFLVPFSPTATYSDRTSSLRFWAIAVLIEPMRQSKKVSEKGSGQYKCWNFLQGRSRPSSGAQSHNAGSTWRKQRQRRYVCTHTIRTKIDVGDGRRGEARTRDSRATGGGGTTLTSCASTKELTSATTAVLEEACANIRKVRQQTLLSAR